MNRSLQVALIGLVGAAAFAVLPGCQNRGTTDTTNAAMPASATMDRAFIAAHDTEWYSSPDIAHSEKGRLAQNSKVFFENTAATGDLQPAKLADGHVVYVKASDFVPAPRQ